MGDNLSSRSKTEVKTMQKPFGVQKQTVVTTKTSVENQKPAKLPWSVTTNPPLTKKTVTMEKTVTTGQSKAFPVSNRAEEKKSIFTIGAGKKEEPKKFAVNPVFSSASKNMTQQLEPVVRERRLWNMTNVITAFAIGVVLVAIEFISIPLFGMSPLSAIVLGLILIVIYAVVLFFLLEPKIMREVFQTTVKTVEKPTYKEIIKTVEKPVVRTVEKPVIKEVTKEVTVEKPVYRTIEKPVVRTVTKPVVKYVERVRKRLNIPKYDYLGSSETKVYHKRSCRLSKLIKRKYKVSSNSILYFKNRGYKPCEVCILKRKKV